MSNINRWSIHHNILGMLTGKGTRCCLVLLAAVCSRSADAQTWTRFEMNRCDAEDQSSPPNRDRAGNRRIGDWMPD